MPKPNPHEVTQLLLAWSEGDKAASVETVHRDWRLAKSWLLRWLRGGTPDEA
jgi:hypothetical protein